MSKPFLFSVPLDRFDTALLPSGAGEVGSDAFEQAVTRYFALQAASKGEQAVVAVDDEKITVFTVKEGTDPLDAITELLQRGQIREAVPYLQALSRAQPDNTTVLYNLGVAFSELGEYDQAIIWLKKAVQADPAYVHAWSAIGVAYQRLGKPDQAMDAMRKAVAAGPDDGYALRNLASVLLSAGQPEEALQHLRRAAEVLPDDPQTLYGLASVLSTVGGETNQAEAKTIYRNIVERFPNTPVAQPSEKALTQLAQQTLRKTGGDLRPDVLMYIQGALETFEDVGPQRVREIAMEIALKGQAGLDINDPDGRYTLQSLPGEFSALHLVSIMYAAFQQLDPSADVGIDLKAEYDAAVALHR